MDGDPVLPEGGVNALVEARVEQALGRTDRVGRVDHDHVALALHLPDDLGPVADDQLEARVVADAARDRGHVLAAEVLDDDPVDLDHRHAS